MRAALLPRLAAAVLCVAPHTLLNSQSVPLDIVYVNGINVSLSGAMATLREMHDALAASPTRSGSERRNFRVSLQYNPAAWRGVFEGIPWVGLGRDMSEVFLLKVAEECYLDDLGANVVPHDQRRPIDRAAAQRVTAYLTDMLPGNLIEGTSQRRCGENSLVTRGDVSASQMASVQGVATSLAANIPPLGRAIVVAHSQGNLLAHLAYASLAANLGDDVSRLMRIVNVANTSSLSVHGLDMTHSKDGVLAGLKYVLPNLGVTRSTPTSAACDPLLPCNFQLAAPSLTAGISEVGHVFAGTYLSDDHVDITNPGTIQFTAGAERFVDRFVDFVYAAAASLDVANSMTVQSAICDSPVVGQPMTCTFVGSGLPADMSASASNCAPSPMAAIAGGSSSQRQFNCVPTVVGLPVTVTYAVPGYVGNLPAAPTQVALAPTVPSPTATNPLNDTGATTCFGNSESTTVSCTSAEAISANDKQDGMIGRDVASGGASDGALGFSFELVPNGIGGLYENTECIRDRVTGLVWEGKPTSGLRAANLTYWAPVFAVSADTAEGYVSYVNSLALCGFTDWRLPTARELQGVVHYGAPVGVPAIDVDWFVNTASASYRTSTGDGAGFRVGLDFASGRSTSLSPYDYYRVRLVR